MHVCQILLIRLKYIFHIIFLIEVSALFFYLIFSIYLEHPFYSFVFYLLSPFETWNYIFTWLPLQNSETYGFVKHDSPVVLQLFVNRFFLNFKLCIYLGRVFHPACCGWSRRNRFHFLLQSKKRPKNHKTWPLR